MKTIFKKILKLILVIFLITLTVAILFFISGYGYVAPIMMYHHVENSNYDNTNYVSPKKFEEHLKFLKDNKYNVISLDDLVTLIKEKKHIKRKTVVITFDDGYRNNYLNAYPLLKKYGFPAIIFDPADSIGQPDRLTIPQMKEMIANGISIGSHTRREAYLPNQCIEKLYDELAVSKKILEDDLDTEIKYIAYPSGGFTDESKKVTKISGYKAGCTTNRGYDKLNKDIFELNRIKFSNKDNSKVILWVKLSGYYNLFRKSKNPY